MRKRLLRRVATLRIRVPGPFSFARTVHKPAGWHWSTPAEVWEHGRGDADGTLWSGVYVGNYAVGLRLRQVRGSSGDVHVDAYAEHALDANTRTALQRTLAEGFGVGEPIAEFYAFARHDRVLASIVRDLRGMRDGSLDDLFGRITLAVTLQLAPVRRSEQMMQLLLEHYGTHLRFDRHEVTLWPTPRRIAREPTRRLQKIARLGYRAKLLRGAARYLLQHPLSVRQLEQLPEEDAHKLLRQIPGVGEYSASIVLGGGHAAIDSWSATIFSELLLGKTPRIGQAAVPRIQRLVDRRFGRWAWLVFVYVLNDLPTLHRRKKVRRIT